MMKPAPADAASHTLLKEQLGDVLSTLTPREEKVLRLRFGLEDGRPRTLEEVGKEFDVTRERIRQIEAKALRKLRHPSRSKNSRIFWIDRDRKGCAGVHINLESDYAARIVYCLTKVDGRLDAQSIAEETCVSLRFTLKIMRKLVAAGIVRSFKGAKGGYQLARGRNRSRSGRSSRRWRALTASAAAWTGSTTVPVRR